MNTKKILIIPILLALLLTACSGGETATPEPTAVPTNTAEPTAEPQQMAEVSAVPIEEVQNIVWLWTGLIETLPAGQSVVPNPENYTLTLLHDNTFTAKADCNNTAGTYQVDGSFITLMLGPTTLAECGPDSLYDQYMNLLSSLATFGMQDGMLVLGLQDAAGQMQFTNGGPAEVAPTPTPRACDAGIDPTTVSINAQGLYENYLVECVLTTPYDESQPPTTTGLPDNIQVHYDLSETQQMVPNEPVIYIIPVEEYIALWQASGNDAVANNIQALKDLLGQKPEPVPTSSMPILPYEEVMGVTDIQMQGKYLDITMGAGVRFVSRFSQGPNPVTRDNPPLFYTFQGFSRDGLYLITFFNPVTSEALPSSEEVTAEEMQQLESDPQAYLDAKTTELNELPASDWQPNLETLDAMIASLKYGDEELIQPGNPLTNFNWLWTTLIQTKPASQSVVADPQSYSMVFYTNGGLFYQADCNTGSGTFTISGNNMTITLGASTLVECGTDSLSSQYVALLDSVATYGFEDGNLVLGLQDGAGQMGFVNGGAVIEGIPPGEDIPRATTTEPLNVRSGPGTEYYSYGVAPVGTTFPVAGISEDGGWWAVTVPTSVAPDGVGWISGAYAVTENTGNVPVIPNPTLITATPTLEATETPEATATPSPEATATAASSNPLVGSSWSMAALNGQPSMEGTTLTLAFSDVAASGEGGCNTFNASYNVDGNSISISGLTVTQSTCGAEIDQQEQTYLSLLESADSYQFEGSQLVLYSGGAEVLRFN